MNLKPDRGFVSRFVEIGRPCFIGWIINLAVWLVIFICWSDGASFDRIVQGQYAAAALCMAIPAAIAWRTNNQSDL